MEIYDVATVNIPWMNQEFCSGKNINEDPDVVFSWSVIFGGENVDLVYVCFNDTNELLAVKIC